MKNISEEIKKSDISHNEYRRKNIVFIIHREYGNKDLAELLADLIYAEKP